MKQIIVKPTINKKNGQINISLPKKKLPKKIVNDISCYKNLKIALETLGVK